MNTRIVYIVLLLVFILTSFNSLAQNTDSAKAYFQKALTFKTERRWQLALNNFEKAVKWDSTQALYFSELGNMAYEMRANHIAIYAFEKLLTLNSNDTNAIVKLTNLYNWYRQDDKAIEFARKVEKLNIGFNTDYIIGMSAYRTEDYDLAIEHLDKALAKDTFNKEIIQTLAQSYLSNNQYVKVIELYERLLKIDTNKVYFIYEMGVIYLVNGNYKKALDKFMLAESKGYKRTVDVTINMANAYFGLNNFDKSTELYLQALEKRPKSQPLLYDVGFSLYRNKKYSDAITYWDRLLQLNPTDYRVLYMIGIAYIRNGDKDKGKALCDKAILMDPSLESLRNQANSLGL